MRTVRKLVATSLVAAVSAWFFAQGVTFAQESEKPVPQLSCPYYIQAAAAPVTADGRLALAVGGKTNLPDRAILCCRLSKKVIGLAGDTLKPLSKSKAMAASGAFEATVQFGADQDAPRGLYAVEVTFDPLVDQYREVEDATGSIGQTLVATCEVVLGSSEQLMNDMKEETRQIASCYETLKDTLDRYVAIAGEVRGQRQSARVKCDPLLGKLEGVMLQYDAKEKGRFYAQSYAAFFAVAKDLHFKIMFELSIGLEVERAYPVEAMPADFDALQRMLRESLQTMGREFCLGQLTVCDAVRREAAVGHCAAPGGASSDSWSSLSKSWKTTLAALETAIDAVTNPDIWPVAKDLSTKFNELLPLLRDVLDRYSALRSLKPVPPEKAEELNVAGKAFDDAWVGFRKSVSQ